MELSPIMLFYVLVAERTLPLPMIRFSWAATGEISNETTKSDNSGGSAVLPYCLFREYLHQYAELITGTTICL